MASSNQRVHVFSGAPSLALRGSLVAQKQGTETAYNTAIFNAYWSDAVDVTDRTRLEATLDAAGLAGKATLATADQIECGERLRG